ncbi:MAG: GIY-YIG nuclease family protein [Patescibacteria group bacterium]
MYYLYILECADNTLYTGIAIHLRRRVVEHNSSKRGAKYTRSRRPVKLVYAKKFRNQSAASREERRIKKLSRKEKLEKIRYESSNTKVGKIYPFKS